MAGLHNIPRYDGRTVLKADALNRIIDEVNRLSNIRGVGGTNITSTANGILIGGSSPGTPSVYWAKFQLDSSNTNTYLNTYPSPPTSSPNATRVFPAQLQTIKFTDNTAGGGGAYDGAGKSSPILTAGDTVAVYNTAIVYGTQYPTFIPAGWEDWIYEVDGQYYYDYPFPKRAVGVLTSSLAQGGSASMLIHYLNSSLTDTASPYTVTVYDYGLQTGGSISSGKEVFAYWIENQFSATIGTSPGYWIVDGATPC